MVNPSSYSSPLMSEYPMVIPFEVLLVVSASPVMVVVEVVVATFVILVAVVVEHPTNSICYHRSVYA